MVWKNKFLVYNLVALIFIKAVFSYSGLQFASLLDGVAVFSKEEVVSQTNVFRKALGLSELRENLALDLAAAQKLEDMKYNNYFAHTSPAGVSPWHWIEVNQYKYSYAGENLALGFFTAKDTVEAWINSPSHRANLANYNYREIGVAVAPAKIQNSEGFLVVQLFGTPRPTTIASAPAKTPAPPRPTPTVVASVSPIPSQAVKLKPATTQITGLPSENEIFLGEEIAAPITSKIAQSSPIIEEVGHALNISLILYAMFAFLVSVILLMLRGLKKEQLVQTASSFALLILAVAVPVLEASRTALIF